MAAVDADRKAQIDYLIERLTRNIANLTDVLLELTDEQTPPERIDDIIRCFALSDAIAARTKLEREVMEAAVNPKAADN